MTEVHVHIVELQNALHNECVNETVWLAKVYVVGEYVNLNHFNSRVEGTVS